ncbi:hypothetical protein AB0K00_19840 [Dactylosporangium sp. NPDC049525]|uniref:hypothetical protein n=1 Tax=Dactylosporangium sp. NPDC049525 TaxID=3154730 RepID=UPI0034209310
MVTGLPAPAADAARDSIAGAIAVAERLVVPELAGSARAAYTDAMDFVLIACAAAVLVGAVLAVIFMPARTPEAGAASVVAGRARKDAPSAR